jgi:hypothetical protein
MAAERVRVSMTLDTGWGVAALPPEARVKGMGMGEGERGRMGEGVLRR